jgi:hypothetical protein
LIQKDFLGYQNVLPSLYLKLYVDKLMRGIFSHAILLYGTQQAVEKIKQKKGLQDYQLNVVRFTYDHIIEFDDHVYKELFPFKD